MYVCIWTVVCNKGFIIIINPTIPCKQGSVHLRLEIWDDDGGISSRDYVDTLYDDLEWARPGNFPDSVTPRGKFLSRRTK